MTNSSDARRPSHAKASRNKDNYTFNRPTAPESRARAVVGDLEGANSHAERQ